MRLRAGFRLEPSWGCYSAPADPLTVFKGDEGEGRGGEWKGSRSAEREERERLTVMRSWNRAADWLRPAELISKTY